MAPLVLWCNPRCSSRVKMGMSGNFLSCCKSVTDPFELQEGRCDFSRDSAVEKGLISPARLASWFFSSCGWFLLNYEGDLRHLLMWPQERPVSMRVVRDLSGFLSIRCRVLSSHLERRPEAEVSSPVLTWILGFPWSLHRGIRPRLEWKYAPLLEASVRNPTDDKVMQKEA